MLSATAAATFAFSGSDLVAKFNEWKNKHAKVHRKGLEPSYLGPGEGRGAHVCARAWPASGLLDDRARVPGPRHMRSLLYPSVPKQQRTML